MSDQYYKKVLKENTECSVELALGIIGGKWKGIIIYNLLKGTMRFSELQKLIPKITHRMLTLQLRELEKDLIVKRTVYPEVPPKVEYELTELGKTLSSVIKEIREWGNIYRESKESLTEKKL